MFFIDKFSTGFVPTKNGPKSAFFIGETGIFCRGVQVVGPKVAFFHIMRLLLIYWCSLCILLYTM